MIPKWNDLTDEQRGALIRAAGYHSCHCMDAADVAHGVYCELVKQLASEPDDESLNLPERLRPPGYVAG